MARLATVLALALALGGCQLLTNFVRPLADDPDADVGDVGTEDGGTEDGGDDAGVPGDG